MGARNRTRDLVRLMADLEAQGARVRKTADGWFVQFPDGSATPFHTSISDHRGLKNQRSKVRRAGLIWPAWFKV